MAEKFCLKWNDFHSNASKSFGLFRNEDYLHDVTLVSDDHKQVSAHKLVLSACSEYFKNIFQSNKKQTHPILCLDGTSSQDLNNVMDYIYNGELQIYQDNLDAFLAIAQRFKLEGLITDNDVQTSNRNQEVENETHVGDFDNSKQIIKSQISSMTNRDNKYSATEKVLVKVSGDESGLPQVNQYVEKTMDNKFKCTICGKVSSTKQNSQYHIETHLEGLSYECKSCGKSYRSKNCLRVHIHQFHRN